MGFFKSFTIVGMDGTPYLKRFFLLKTRWFSIYLHKIMRSDADRELHDHPWPFVSFILKGGYTDVTFEGEKVYRRFSVNKKKAEDAHRLRLFTDSSGAEIPTWTLVFLGPKQREWGFWFAGLPGTKGFWVHHVEYLDMKFGKGNWTKEPDYYDEPVEEEIEA